jgi:hypothetical protein
MLHAIMNNDTGEGDIDSSRVEQRADGEEDEVATNYQYLRTLSSSEVM